MEIIGLIKKAEKAEKDKVYSELMDTSKTEVTSLAMDKTIDNSAPFNFDDIYTRPFFINNYAIVDGNIVDKKTNKPIISKVDYENLLRPTFPRWWIRRFRRFRRFRRIRWFWRTDGGSVTPPSTQTSQKPIVFTLTAGDNYVSGSGVANSTINVTLPNSTVLTTTVDSANNWIIPLKPRLNQGDIIKTTQTETR